MWRSELQALRGAKDTGEAAGKEIKKIKGKDPPPSPQK